MKDFNSEPSRPIRMWPYLIGFSAVIAAITFKDTYISWVTALIEEMAPEQDRTRLLSIGYSVYWIAGGIIVMLVVLLVNKLILKKTND